MLKKAFVVAVTAILALIFTACSYFAIDNYDDDRSFDVPAESISLSDTSITVYIGETASITASVFPKNTIDKVAYSSDNTNVAEIDETGLISAKGVGEATIYAKAGFLSASCRIKVASPPPETVSANVSVLDLKVSESFKLEAGVFPENADHGELVFFSDDERIATVDDTGVITAVGVGYTSVGIYIPEAPRVRCVVEVNAFADSIEDMRFSKNCCAVLKDSTSALELNIEPFGMSADSIVFTSSDETIATVDANGIVKGVEYGTAVITASAPQGISAECSIVVTKRLAADPTVQAGSSPYIFEDGIYTHGSSEGTQAEIMLAGAVYADSQRQSDARTDGGFDFSESFVYLKKYLDPNGLAIASLNSTLSYSAAYGCEGGEEYNSPSSLLGALRYAGFDALATTGITSNCENGQTMLETAEQIEKYELMNAGVSSLSGGSAGVIAETAGIKIGLLSYDINAPKETPCCYSKRKAENDISKLKKNGAEFVIVYLNCGGASENELNSVFSDLAKAGAGCAIGVDPKVLKGAQYFDTHDGGSMLAVYSLGSISADSSSDTANDTAMIKLTLEKQDGEAVVSEAEYLSIRLIGSYEGNSYVSVPAHSQDSNSSLKLAAERISKIMGGVLKELEN